MKCIRCNKDFEGEGNLCEDCKKKFELEQSTAQTTSNKKVNPFKKYYSNNVKTYLTQKEKVKNLSIIMGAVIILLIIIICVKNSGKSSSITSKVGNIREYGYADEYNGWIYYIAPDKELSKMGVYRVKENGTKQEEINIIGNNDIMSLNVYKNYIYFIVQETSAYSNNGDTLNNKIYRMKIDGSDLEVINDNEFHNNCESIYVLNNSVYYIGTDAKLYKMGLNGKNKKVVSDEVFAVTKPYNNYIVTDDYIIYNKEDNSSGSAGTYTTMIMGIDGKGMKAVVEDEYLSYIDVDDSYIYFTDSDNILCKTKINSGKKEELYKTRKVYHLNVKGDYAYFYSYTDNSEVALYRINLKSIDKGAQAIKVLNTTTPCLNIVMDRLYITDRDDAGGFVIKLLNAKKIDDSAIIYSYQYTDMEDDDSTLLEELSDNGEASNNDENDTSNSTANDIANDETTTDMTNEMDTTDNSADTSENVNQ